MTFPIFALMGVGALSFAAGRFAPHSVGRAVALGTAALIGGIALPVTAQWVRGEVKAMGDSQVP